MSLRLSLAATHAVVWIVPIAALVSGCGRSAPHEQKTGNIRTHRTPVLYTTFTPTAYFVSRIVGEHARVVCPVPEGEDPIFWKPSAEAIEQYQNADLIVINGAEYEKWVACAALPESRVVDISVTLRGELMTYQTTTHSHGSAGQHTHEGIDGHTWMDPWNAIQQSVAIVAELKKRWPADAREWDSGFDALVADLQSLDARLTELAKRGSTAVIIASHPAYNYIAKRYRITIHNVAMAPEEALSDASLASLQAVLRDHPTDSPRILLWEEEPLESTRRQLQTALMIRSVSFSPCENMGTSAGGGIPDYIGAMRDNVARLENALAGAR